MKESTAHISRPLSDEGRKQLYLSLGLNMAVYNVQLDYLCSILKIELNDKYAWLYRNISFMALDLCAVLRACLNAKSLYERRFHVKYLWVNMYEAYVALYNHSGDAKSYMNQLRMNDKSLVNDCEYEMILKRLAKIHDVFSGISDNRNSFIHYDDDMLETHKRLVGIKSEEEPTKLCCELLAIFEMVKKLCERNINLIIDPSWQPSNNEIADDIFAYLRGLLAQNQSMRETIGRIIQSVPNDINSDVKLIKCFADPACKKHRSVGQLLNIHIMIQLMRLDLAVSLNACFNASNNIESMLGIRRAQIIRQEGLNHIQEMWKRLPENLRNADEELLIVSLVKAEDNESRNSMVHYRYGSKDYLESLYEDCKDVNKQKKILEDIPMLLNSLTQFQNLLTSKLKQCSYENDLYTSSDR